MNWHLNEPFWNSKIVYRESLLFIRNSTGEVATAGLLFYPTRIFSLTTTSGHTAYKYTTDYELLPETLRLMRLPGCDIPYLDRSELIRNPGQDHSIAQRRGSPKEHLYFSEGSHFHNLQVEITYQHQDTWEGAVPSCAGQKLSKTQSKILAGKPMTIYLAGDSIAEGSNASKFTGSEPFMPSFGELVAEELSSRWDCAVDFHNLAVGGMRSEHAVQVAPQIAAARPDLAILAYGMNDVAQRDPQAYRKNLADALQVIRQDSPETEFILVAPMLGNPEWEFTPQEAFPLYRDALLTLCAEGIALADMTALWTDLLKYKSYYDLTGNGVNHPNDFGHRLYAQAILSLLLGKG